MNALTFKPVAFAVLVLVVVVGAGTTAGAVIIYHDSFSRTGALNGSTPDITRNSDSWVATDGTTDGSVYSMPSSNFWAVLPFAAAGKDIYTLSVDASPQNDNTYNWLSLGFMNDLDQTKAKQGPWMLVRANGDIQAFGGPAISNLVYDGLGGNPGQFNNLQVVLDTTHAAWTSTFYVNGAQVGSTFTYASNPAIVGVHLQNYSISGSYDNFSLTSEVPEPTTLALWSGLGAMWLVIAWRRGKRRGVGVAAEPQ